MDHKPWLPLALAITFALTACDQSEQTDEETLEADTVAVDDEDLIDEVEEGIEETGEAIEEGVEETGKAIEEGAEKVNP